MSALNLETFGFPQISMTETENIRIPSGNDLPSCDLYSSPHTPGIFHREKINLHPLAVVMCVWWWGGHFHHRFIDFVLI